MGAALGGRRGRSRPRRSPHRRRPARRRIPSPSIRPRRRRARGRCEAQFPSLTLRDVTPHLDRLRLIKTAREIEILRYNGRISAEAMTRAIKASAPGQVRVRARSRGDRLDGETRHPGRRLPCHRRLRADGESMALPGQRAADERRRARRHGLRRLARLPDDRHHADMAGVGTVHGEQRKAYEAVLDTQKAIIARHQARRDAQRRPAACGGHDAQARVRSALCVYRDTTSGCRCTTSATGACRSRRAWCWRSSRSSNDPNQQLHVRIEDTMLVTATGAEVLSRPRRRRSTRCWRC